MTKHRCLIVGAGRIGAGFNWHDDDYTHAGAYRALSDRVELVGFVETDEERANAARAKWEVPVKMTLIDAFVDLRPDIVSVCVQPEWQSYILGQLGQYKGIKGIWCEKPWTGTCVDGVPMQVNFMRRADPEHRFIAGEYRGGRLVVYGKDDIHTRCHFEDLQRWWEAELDYRPLLGPCSYVYTTSRKRLPLLEGDGVFFFDNGGVRPASCMKAMLANLLSNIDHGTPLFSPPYMENANA